ncbi:CD206 [Mytilus edulis]|uniref:MRC n=1 Tax=Mytilus edulis TaxID=6550 RepID=A0A8S3PUV7_MYTED|nr:CD206 [Mytilus edulis]
MFSVHCDDIQQDQLQNGQTVNITGTEVGDTATFSCKAGYVFLGNQSIEKKCQETGWSGGGIQTCVGCPETVINFRGTTYKFNCGDFTFDQAEAFCKNQGGNITSIETEEENSFLKHILTLIKSAGGASANNWWIGFTDIKTEGSFEWISGQPVTYTDWFQGPPPEPNGETWNNAQADCVLMRYSYGFQWTDDYCGFIDGHAICELW